MALHPKTLATAPHLQLPTATLQPRTSSSSLQTLTNRKGFQDTRGFQDQSAYPGHAVAAPAPLRDAQKRRVPSRPESDSALSQDSVTHTHWRSNALKSFCNSHIKMLELLEVGNEHLGRG